MLVRNEDRVPFETLSKEDKSFCDTLISLGSKKIEVLFHVPITEKSYYERIRGKVTVGGDNISQSVRTKGHRVENEVKTTNKNPRRYRRTIPLQG